MSIKQKRWLGCVSGTAGVNPQGSAKLLNEVSTRLRQPEVYLCEIVVL